MAVPSDRTPWVLVAGGFHDRGGMDRANAALASYLSGSGTPVHLVGHDIDDRFVGQPLTAIHRVPRPKGLPGLAEWALGRAGMRVAHEVRRRAPGARVVVNGGNCPWPDVNWMHALHAAWEVRDDGAPWWSRYRTRRLKAVARRRERAAIQRARLVIANSESTRTAIVERLGLPPRRVRTIYLGSDPGWGAVDPAERRDAREALHLPSGVPVVAFLGALGADVNKGFDVLWRAWSVLSEFADWDARLLVAGDGWRRRGWQREADRARGGASVRFLGATSRVRELLAASDLLVSPVRYEAYGLNVHEALCCGLPVMVTHTAGVTERIDEALADGLLPADISAEALADRLRRWRDDLPGWRERAASTAARIRARSWNAMASDFVAAVRDTPLEPGS